MRAFVENSAGEKWELPAAERWELEYGVGTPCDSFCLCCPWTVGMTADPAAWARFYAEHEGKRVFSGVVDECEVSLTARGRYLELSGRGMAALLLDNEALGQDYQVATLADILRDHVTPYGIEVLGGQLPAVSRFRVDTGSSEWTVLEEFVRAAGGETPRFDPWGRLLLGVWEEKEQVTIGAGTPVTALLRRDKRYGVLSEVLVRDRYSGAVQRVKNEEFWSRGGQARRVVTMPGRAQADSMRRSGREQLERSGREQLEIEITLPVPFFAMPGELVSVERSGLGEIGLFRVARSTVGMDTEGYWTRLVLRKPENV